MTTQMERPLTVPYEQRDNRGQRQRFDAALELLRPIMKQDDAPQGASYYRAFSKLHNSFPDMTQSELEALVVSVVRSLNGR